jgi:hypothetical protein
VIWPLPHLIEAVRVARADRLFAPSIPGRNNIGARNELVVADALATDALRLAVAQLGCGESGGNNCGPDVERYVAPARTPANWCAGFVGWCYQEAARCMDVPLPFKRSLGAKRLGKNVGAVGRIFQDPALLQPGDLMVFDRGAKGSWMGHVALVESTDRGTLLDHDHSVRVRTIEGNAAPKVLRLVRSVDRDRFAFFASLRR